MKTIIPGIMAFLICWAIYIAFDKYMDVEKYQAYHTGYQNGFEKKRHIESDSLNREIATYNKWSDSIRVEINKIRKP